MGSAVVDARARSSSRSGSARTRSTSCDGHPLGHGSPDRALVALEAVSIAGAVALGVYASVAYTPWLAPFVVAGAFIVCAYNLELFGGAFHSDFWFAIAWGVVSARRPPISPWPSG